MNTLNEQRRAHIRQLCEHNGIRITPTGPRAYRLHGRGIDIITADLASVLPAELEPKRKPWAIGRQG